MLHDFFINLMLHGGEGGDGASAAPDGETAGAEETGVTAPDAGERTKRPNKAERRARMEAQLRAEAQERAQTAAQPQPEKRPFDEIEQLYHDEIGQKIQTAIQGRFKNQTDNAEELNSTKAELEKQSKLLAALAESQYGIKPGADGKIDLAAIEGKVIPRLIPLLSNLNSPSTPNHSLVCYPIIVLCCFKKFFIGLPWWLRQ